MKTIYVLTSRCLPAKSILRTVSSRGIITDSPIEVVDLSDAENIVFVTGLRIVGVTALETAVHARIIVWALEARGFTSRWRRTGGIVLSHREVVLDIWFTAIMASRVTRPHSADDDISHDQYGRTDYDVNQLHHRV